MAGALLRLSKRRKVSTACGSGRVLAQLETRPLPQAVLTGATKMTDNAEKLPVTLENGIKRITFNRPGRRNSVDGEMVQLLLAAIKESENDGTQVVILTGAGDSFCAGADLAATSASDIVNFDVTKSLRENVNPAILAMRALPVPIIARVHGHAVGVGFNYALACDMIIASGPRSSGRSSSKSA